MFLLKAAKIETKINNTDNNGQKSRKVELRK